MSDELPDRTHEQAYRCPDCGQGDIKVLVADTPDTIAQCDFCSFEATVAEVVSTLERVV